MSLLIIINVLARLTHTNFCDPVILQQMLVDLPDGMAEEFVPVLDLPQILFKK